MPYPATAQPQTTPPRRSGWSPERRARHAAAIRKWKPWMRSTGPRTPAGKAASAQNARKHSPARDAASASLTRALAAHARFLTDFNRYLTLRRKNAPNELLNALRLRLAFEGAKVTRWLETAFAHVRRRKNLDFPPRFAT